MACELVSVLARIIESVGSLRHRHLFVLLLAADSSHHSYADLGLLRIAINTVIEVNLGLISLLQLFLIRLETWLRRVHLTHLLCERALTWWRLISLPDQEL